MTRALTMFALVQLACGCDRPAPLPETHLPEAAVCPAEALDRVDGRSPLPLLPGMANHQKQAMREHLVAVQEIVSALASDDFDGVARAAGRIGLSESMGQMCTHMGMAAPGFTEQALQFHRTADRVASAARERDRAQVLTTLSETVQTCTSCHATWKQQLVDEATWQRLTASAAPLHTPSP